MERVSVLQNLVSMLRLKLDSTESQNTIIKKILQEKSNKSQKLKK